MSQNPAELFSSPSLSSNRLSSTLIVSLLPPTTTTHLYRSSRHKSTILLCAYLLFYFTWFNYYHQTNLLWHCWFLFYDCTTGIKSWMSFLNFWSSKDSKNKFLVRYKELENWQVQVRSQSHDCWLLENVVRALCLTWHNLQFFSSTQ